MPQMPRAADDNGPHGLQVLLLREGDQRRVQVLPALRYGPEQEEQGTPEDQGGIRRGEGEGRGGGDHPVGDIHRVRDALRWFRDQGDNPDVRPGPDAGDNVLRVLHLPDMLRAVDIRHIRRLQGDAQDQRDAQRVQLLSVRLFIVANGNERCHGDDRFFVLIVDDRRAS